MQEVWKDVKGYEGLYQISNLGNVKSVGIYHKDNKGNVRYLKRNREVKQTNDRGYLKIQLNKNKTRKTKYIHQLVAEAFIPNPNNYKEVNHIDSNPENNCENNLEWCDRRYNIDYMLKHQEEIKERHERRIEILETIYYGIELGRITTIDQVRNLIDENLLGGY